nr:hypothetical protein [Tanacetum cinerariifolium]
MFEDKSYEAHKDHKNLFDALEKSLEHDYSNQLLSDLEAARQKKRKRRDLPRTPSGSPPPQTPPPPTLAGASGALGTSGASGSSQLPLPPPPLSTGTLGSAQQQGSKTPTSPKSVATTPHSMAWTIFDTRYESNGVFVGQESSPTDSMMNETPFLMNRYNCLTMKTPRMITCLMQTREKTGGNHCLKKKDQRLLNLLRPFPFLMYFKGNAYEVVKAFYLDVIHLQFHMEVCHKLLTDQIDWANIRGDQVKINVSGPLPFGGPPGHVSIQT